jgi:hypothetical protein
MTGARKWLLGATMAAAAMLATAACTDGGSHSTAATAPLSGAASSPASSSGSSAASSAPGKTSPGAKTGSTSAAKPGSGASTSKGATGGASQSTAKPPGGGSTPANTSGVPKPGASTSDPNSPFVVASVAVAKRSRDQITELHALAVNAGHANGIPSASIPLTAKSVSAELTSEIAASTQLKPPAGTPAAALAASLTTYVSLANQLGAWNPKSNAPLSATYFTQLKSNDAKWQAALKDLGKSANTDLLKNMAPLLYPKA